MTDKLRSYPVAHREVIPEAIHVTDQYANNRAEQSHEATRVRERWMRRCNSMKQAQRFVSGIGRLLDTPSLDFYGINDLTCMYLWQSY